MPGLTGEMRTDGTELPGMSSLPDEGFSAGPLNLTPRTVGGFAGSMLLDPLSYGAVGAGAFGRRALGQAPQPRVGQPSPGLSSLLASQQGGVTHPHFGGRLPAPPQYAPERPVVSGAAEGPSAAAGMSPLDTRSQVPGELNPRVAELRRQTENAEYPIQGGQPGPAPMTPEAQAREYVLERGPMEDVTPGRGWNPYESEGLSYEQPPQPGFMAPFNDPRPQRPLSSQSEPSLSPQVEKAASRYNETVKGATTPFVSSQGEFVPGGDPLDAAGITAAKRDLIEAYSRLPERQVFGAQDYTRNAMRGEPGGRYPALVQQGKMSKGFQFTEKPPADLWMPDGSVNPKHMAWLEQQSEGYLREHMKDFDATVNNRYNGRNPTTGKPRPNLAAERIRQEGLLSRNPLPESGRSSRGGPASTDGPQFDDTLHGNEVSRERGAGSGAMRTVSQKTEGGTFEEYGNEYAPDFERQGWFADDEALRKQAGRPGYAGDSGESVAAPGRKLQFATADDAARYRDAFAQVRQNNELIPQLQSAAAQGDKTAEAWLSQRLYPEQEKLHQEMEALVRGESRFGGNQDLSNLEPEMPGGPNTDDLVPPDQTWSSEYDLLPEDVVGSQQMRKPNPENMEYLAHITARANSRMRKPTYGKFQKAAFNKSVK